MSAPAVSFVVPCYKLAHLLPECIDSILGQTYRDFEVLIMDDCSPDDTAVVAQSFEDERVRYIRNKVNIGHLRNYNEGISLSRGRYIWLISADDYLLTNDVLQQYVPFMDAHPAVGYVFSSGVGVRNGCRTGVLTDFYWGDKKLVFNGREFLSKVLPRGGILAPSTMVRAECYHKVSLFPLDMPHQADLYLWCLWALHYDVAYFAQPTVAYRLHAESTMEGFKRSRPLIIIEDQLTLQWRIKRAAESSGCASSVKTWASRVRDLYAFCLLSDKFETSPYRMTFSEFEASLLKRAESEAQAKSIRARVYAGVADGCYERTDPAEAYAYYRIALTHDFMLPIVWTKIVLLRLGAVGAWIRGALTGVGAPETDTESGIR